MKEVIDGDCILKKETGFSTFLRGCNPVPLRLVQSNQSTFGHKNKTIFYKAKNRVTFDAENINT